jgi:hypothetical protein
VVVTAAQHDRSRCASLQSLGRAIESSHNSLYLTTAQVEMSVCSRFFLTGFTALLLSRVSLWYVDIVALGSPADAGWQADSFTPPSCVPSAGVSM